jgi:hypothetical protein
MTDSRPPDIQSGFLRAYFVFDVATQIDLSKLSAASDKDYQPDQIKFNTTTAPSYIQFAVAPMVAQLAPIEVEGRQAEVRLKIFDYGTIAIRLSIPYAGDWDQFSKLSRDFRASKGLVKSAEQVLQNVLKEVEHVFTKPHEALVEDYFVAEVTNFARPTTGTELLQNHKTALASLVSGEVMALSPGEQDEALRIRFSYFESELVIVTWDLSFIFDTPDGADTVESIIEFANTQLVELRTYDSLLDKHLDEIYKWKSERERSHWLSGKRIAERQAEKLRYLLVDVQELSDRANNALKMIGDAYYARLYRGVATRFALSDWQKQIESKLESVGTVYRFATDQAQHARSEFLELIVIALIAIEILIGLFSLHH